MTKLEQAVVKAAIRWWRSKRPIYDFTEKAHLENPYINLTNLKEGPLALAVRNYLRHRRALRR